MGKAPFKMKSAAHGGPMRKNFPSAFRKETEPVEGGILPEVKVSGGKGGREPVKTRIEVSEGGVQTLIKSQVRDGELVESRYQADPKYTKKTGGKGTRWVNPEGGSFISTIGTEKRDIATSE